MYVYSLIVNVCRRPRSSLPIRYVNHTIDRIKYLFQNGRLLLTCIVFTAPTIGNPDVFLINTQPSVNTSSSTQCRAHLNKHFKTVFSPVSHFCVVVEAPLQPQCRRDILLIFAIISENSTDPSFQFLQVLTSYITTVRFVSCLLCCCRVSLQPQFRHFRRELFLIFVCLLRKFDRF